MSKPVLKTKRLSFQRLTVQCDELLSSFAFNFHLRRYNADMEFDLRFVFKTAPTLGTVDFLCATDAGRCGHYPPSH